MRVLVVSSSFPCSPDDPSGHFVRAEAERLARSGHEVHVVAPSAAYEATPTVASGLVVHRAGGGALFGWPGAIERLRRAPWRLVAGAAFLRGARRHLRNLGRFDSIHAHWLVPTAWPLLDMVDEPLELFAHGADVRLLAKLPRPLSAHLVARWLERGGRIHFASHSLRHALRDALPPRLGAALERASDVRSPTLTLPSRASIGDAGRQALGALGLSSRRPLVMTAGRVVRAKRLDVAVRAMALLPRDVQWLVVGDGPAQTELARQCRAARLDVRLCGRRGRPETLALMAEADALLHPSTREAAPTVVREARALGVPVVACRAGDVARWAEHDAGIHLAGSDPGSLARVLGQVLCRGPAARNEPGAPLSRPERDPGLLPGPLPGHASRLDRDPSRSEA